MTDDLDGAIEIPDAIAPIVAYRAWNWFALPNHIPALYSLNRHPWEPGWNRAVCLRGQWGVAPAPDHVAPAEGCSCGIYAVKDLVRAALPFTRFDRREPYALVGKVELAGTVIEHDYGYRAERGRVIEILPGPEQYALAFWVARRYGASVSHELRDASARIDEARRLYVPDPGPLRLPPRPPPRPKGPRTLPPDRSNEPRFPWATVVGRFAWMLMLWAMIGHSDSPVVLGFLVATVVTVAWFRFQVPARIRRRRHSKERPKVKRGGLFSRGQRSVVPFYWGWGVKGTRD